MTLGQKRWLEKLAHDGPQRRPRYGAQPMAKCKKYGWTSGQWRDAKTNAILTVEQVISRKSEGVWVIENLTKAGRDALKGKEP